MSTIRRSRFPGVRMLVVVVTAALALGSIGMPPALASPTAASPAVTLQVGSPPGAGGPPGPPSVGGAATPTFVLQILRAVLPPPVLRLLESLGVLQPASP